MLAVSGGQSVRAIVLNCDQLIQLVFAQAFAAQVKNAES